MSEDKQKTSVTLSEGTFEALDELKNSDSRFQYRNDVIEVAVRRFMNEQSEHRNIGVRLCPDSVYLLKQEKDRVVYLKVDENGKLYKEELSI